MSTEIGVFKPHYDVLPTTSIIIRKLKLTEYNKDIIDINFGKKVEITLHKKYVYVFKFLYYHSKNVFP